MLRLSLSCDVFTKPLSLPIFKNLSFNPSSDILKPPSHILNDKRYSNFYIIKDYKYGCITQIYLKNSLRKYQRIKQFYVFKYKKHYNIDKIEKKC